MMTRFMQERRQSGAAEGLLEWSATGNITTGKRAMEYALRGASSFQLHTYFQLPAELFCKKEGSRTEKALHELYFHPQTGWIAWLVHLAGRLDLPRGPIRFLDVPRRAVVA
jgi:hypothetical protein